MTPDHTRLPLSRRDLLKLSGGPPPSWAPRPSRGPRPPSGAAPSACASGIRPTGIPQLTISYKTHIRYTFTHSRLSSTRPAPAVAPGTFPLEGDLAESWTQPNETTYVFKLRRGVRWHNKPPVNGRELTADDVVYIDRALPSPSRATPTPTCSPRWTRSRRSTSTPCAFILKEPFAWFLDMLANPMAVCIVAKECVEKFGDLKKPEAVVGTGPWMLDSYRPNVGLHLRPQPELLRGRAALHRQGGGHRWTRTTPRAWPPSSPASTTSAGRIPGTINRLDWVQIKDMLKQQRPRLQTDGVRRPT